MFEVFKKPLCIENLESWAKNLDDIAKVAIISIPVVLYGDATILSKVISISLLSIFSYIFIVVAALLRKNKDSLTVLTEEN